MAIVVSLASKQGEDNEAIVAIDAASFVQGTVDVAEELARPWSRVWVAREAEDDPPRAFLLAWLVADELHILSVATLPVFRRRGLATALLERAIDLAREQHVRLVLLEVRRSNEAAIRLYHRLGFSSVGVRPSYYADNLEDAVEMRLDLGPSRGGTDDDML